MYKHLILLLLFLSFTLAISSQENKEDNEKGAIARKDQTKDSIETDLRKQGIMVQEAIFKKEKKNNPLAPSKAAFYSAILPGLGQFYNQSYWKIPLVYAAIGTGIFAYDFNNSRYQRFRAAFKRRQVGFTDDEFYDLPPKGAEPPTQPEFSTQALQDAQERYQRDRDLALLITIGLYALNIIDANVDAHLKQFNIDEDLSLDFNPYFDYNQIAASTYYGMALTLKF